MARIFLNIEVKFNKINDKQFKDRYADVLLNEKYILEIQHSDITESEINCRNEDYKLHGKEILMDYRWEYRRCCSR